MGIKNETARCEADWSTVIQFTINNKYIFPDNVYSKAFFGARWVCFLPRFPQFERAERFEGMIVFVSFTAL